jgi:hypothetical protein
MSGIFDDDGHIHDLSGEVRDISEEVLLLLSLNRLKRLAADPAHEWIRQLTDRCAHRLDSGLANFAMLRRLRGVRGSAFLVAPQGFEPR